eukprot:649006-Hanusia_phi.AAC.1
MRSAIFFSGLPPPSPAAQRCTNSRILFFLSWARLNSLRGPAAGGENPGAGEGGAAEPRDGAHWLQLGGQLGKEQLSTLSKKSSTALESPVTKGIIDFGSDQPEPAVLSTHQGLMNEMKS